MLDEQPAGNALEVELAGGPGRGARGRRGSASRACAATPRAPALRTPARSAPRRTARASRSPSSSSTGAVARDDAAVGRGRVAGERPLVRGERARADRDAARVGVLHDHACRERELVQQPHRAGQVVEVVERELAAVQLLDAREQVAARGVLAVEGGSLVRVLAVREVELLREREREACRELLDLGEPSRDRRVVGGGGREGVGGESPAGLDATRRRPRAAPRARARTAPAGRPRPRGRSSSPPRAAATARRRRSARPPRPRSRRAAPSPARTGTGSRRRGRTARSRARSSVATSSSRSRRARIPAWMRGWSVLTRPPSSSGTSVSDSTRVTSRPSSSRCAAVPPLATSSQPSSARPRAKASSPDLSEVEISARTARPPRAGASRCSAAWIRVSSVSRGSTGTGTCARIGPESRPSSTTCTVTPVVSTPASSACSIAWGPGRRGASDGCTFTIRSGKRSRNGCVSRCRYPARTTRSTPSSSSQVAIARSRSSRSRGSRGRRSPSGFLPRARAVSAWASRRFDATAAIGRPASRSACRFVPFPETRTPITRGGR